MNTNNNTTTPSSTTERSPWQRPARRLYEDLILSEEYQDRRLQLKMGPNWLRILPAQDKSILSNWLLPVYALTFKEGKFAHPKTLTPNAKSVFDIAYTWLSKHKPQMLFSKQHTSGVRLLTDPIALFWVAVDEGAGPVFRLLQASGYDGSRGGSQGLGYQIWKLACQHALAPGEFAPDAADPEEGVQICIEKVQAAGAKYPSYRLQRGQNKVPMELVMMKMSKEECEILCPIEQTVRELSTENQWARLATLIPKPVVEEMRASLG
jgi:hypothetical protein